VGVAGRGFGTAASRHPPMPVRPVKPAGRRGDGPRPIASPAASQQPGDRIHQVVRQARFGEEEIAPGAGRAIAVGRPRARCHHDEGNGHGAGVALEPCDELEAADVAGERNLRDDGVDARRDGERVAPGRHRHDLEAMVMQERRIDLTGIWVRVGDQDDFVVGDSRGQHREPVGGGRIWGGQSVGQKFGNCWVLMQNEGHGLAGSPGRRRAKSGAIPPPAACPRRRLTSYCRGGGRRGGGGGPRAPPRRVGPPPNGSGRLERLSRPRAVATGPDQATFAAGIARFGAGPLVRAAARVGRFAALAGDFTLLVLTHDGESSRAGAHGVLLEISDRGGANRATRRQANVAPRRRRSVACTSACAGDA